MLDRIRLHRTSWTLLDQAVVSLGAFLLNVQLARNLSVLEYGTFAILFACFLSLQLFNSSLIFHPLSVRLVVTDSKAQRNLLSIAFLLNIVSSLSLGLLLAVGLWLLGHGEIIAPAVASFFFWQMQEGMRRGLLAQFRHQTAIWGDALNYVGQAIAVTALVMTHTLSLLAILYSMAAISALAAVVQAIQLGLRVGAPDGLQRVVRDCWSAGSWVLGYNLVSLLRLQGFVWVLAASTGPTGAAWFQAALNVANLANPIVLGLCNVIPQTASQMRAKGMAASWNAARAYGFLGMPLTFGYYVIALAVPEVILWIFYGAGSPYLDSTTVVRLLVLALMLNYWADLVASFLNGVDAAHVALSINLAASATAVVLACLLISPLGLIGCCLAAVGANAVRLAVSVRTVTRFVAQNEPLSLRPGDLPGSRLLAG